MRGLNKIISTAQHGALDAQKTYSLWSGGLGVDYSGVEAYVSAKIAERIHTDLHGTRRLLVGLEYPVQQIIADIGRKVRGRKGGRLDDNGRVDVIVWDNDGVPRVIIEVKRQLRWQALKEDAKRLRQFMLKFGSQHEDGTIEAGIIVVPFITCKNIERDEIHPKQSTIGNVEESALELGFRMEKIISIPLEEEDRLRYPNRDDDGNSAYENIQYNSGCLSLRADEV